MENLYVIYGDELMHHGIKGQKWGIRRTAAQLGHVVKSAGKKVSSKVKASADEASAKQKSKAEVKRLHSGNLKKMTNAELQERIDRLNLEKTYQEAVAATTSSSSKFVSDILKTVGRNTISQLVDYGLGMAVNKAIEKMTGDTGVIVSIADQKREKSKKAGQTDEKKAVSKSDYDRLNDKINMMRAEKTYKELEKEVNSTPKDNSFRDYLNEVAKDLDAIAKYVNAEKNATDAYEEWKKRQKK